MRRLVAIVVLGVSLPIATVVGALSLPSLAGEAAGDLGIMVFLFAGLWLYWGLGRSSLCEPTGTSSAGCSRSPPPS